MSNELWASGLKLKAHSPQLTTQKNMKHTRILFAFFALSITNAFAQKDLSLWYKQPAAVWTEALPVGNGRLGAMVFGRVEEELLQLNEATLWSGGPVKHNVNPESKDIYRW